MQNGETLALVTFLWAVDLFTSWIVLETPSKEVALTFVVRKASNSCLIPE
jgi:hypothetical protein